LNKTVDQMTELRTFRKFTDYSQAQNLVSLLSDNDINSTLNETASSLDSTFGGGESSKIIEIQLNQSDFEKANSILAEEAEILINRVDDDHYLFDFTNEELYDLLLKPDEWNEFDYKLATKILNDRGENVSPDLIKSLKSQRIKDLEKPEESQKTWIYIGYLFSLLGGLLGMFVGWHIWKGTKTLPDGRKVLSYNTSDRKHGRNIFYIGIIIFPIAFAFRLYYEI